MQPYTPPRSNAWMYSTPLRVKDVYGHFLWISAEHYNNPKKVLIPICRRDGLLREFTQAGNDHMNMLHRENIAEVREAQ